MIIFYLLKKCKQLKFRIFFTTGVNAIKKISSHFSSLLISILHSYK